MRRTEQVQGLRLMKFEEVYGRTHRGGLSQAEAAEVLGVSERTFRRWRDRYEAEGADGLYDRRLGRLSARRAPVDEVARVLELFDTRYWDFTANTSTRSSSHFHEKLVADHGFKRSYNWLRLSLQAHGRRRAAPRRGAHRRKRPRRALPGMMLHQDGSSHEWVPGRWWDLIVTMDDATSDIYSAFFVAEEGTMSSFQGVSEAIRAKGLFCSLYADRASHYWNTPEAGGKVDKDTPTQVGRALAQLGIELIPAYSPEARGRSERMFGTLQKRLPQELRLAGITDMVEANRFLKEVFLPQHNARFATPAEDRGTAFVPFTGALDDILCIHEERTTVRSQTTTRCATSAWHFRSPPAATAAITSRPGSASTNTPTAQWPSSMDRDVWRDTTPMANRSTAKPARPRDPLRRDRPVPCGQVDSRSATDHFPTGPETATEAVNSYDLSREQGAGLVCPVRHQMAAHLIEMCRRRSRRPCGADRRSGRLALDAQAGDPRQHHRPGAAATIARVEPGGECLAIHARQLVVEPDLQILRRHRRAVLPSRTSTNHGRSCSACANGRMGSDQ